MNANSRATWLFAAILCTIGPITCPAGEIHEAAEAGDVDRITAILSTNRDLLQSAGRDNLSPLHSAAQSGKTNALQVLIEHGANVNAADDHGCTPLHSAVYGQRYVTAELLLKHGANVNAARHDGTTPLYYAARDGNTNLVSLLVERGANVRAKDNEGHTALHAAVRRGQKEMAIWLLDHGADPVAQDRSGRRAVDYLTGVTNSDFILLLARNLTPFTEPTQPVKVGDIGDLDRIVFEGAESFSPQQLAEALARKPGYLIASHPQANSQEFLEELQRMVLSGYQSLGFPEAQVSVKFDPALLRARVAIKEGPRFNAGKIHVLGTKSSSRTKLARWFTTPADTSEWADSQRAWLNTGFEWTAPNAGGSLNASVEVTEHRRAKLKTPGKAERPDDPIWVTNDPVDFTPLWAMDAVAQIEACLAEQGFFFAKAKAELRPNPKTHRADLWLTVEDEGPPGVIGEIKVVGQRLNTADEITRFLKFRKGMKITADGLIAAQRKLWDSGRFLQFEITPEYPNADGQPSSRHVNLFIGVREMEDIPPLSQPLSPTQQALVNLCKWLEQFPARNEEIAFVVRNPEEFEGTITFALSPKRGLLLSADLGGKLPVSAGFLLATDTVQLCAWSSNNKLAGTREGYGKFFVHLLPNDSNNTNRFNLSLGGGYSSSTSSARQRPLLAFDIALARASFLELAAREDVNASVTGNVLMVTHGDFQLRADARTGKILDIFRPNNHSPASIQFGGNTWDKRKAEFSQRSQRLTNSYSPGHEFSSFFALLGGEAAHLYLIGASTNNAEQSRLASAAIRKLVNPEVLAPMDWVFPSNRTNDFKIPLDEMERAMAANSLASLFSGVVFDWSTRMFPKHSWPWTVARESAFVLLSQGRYTDLELERLHNSEATGPIGFLTIATLLKQAGSPATKAFALQGLTHLSSEDFLADCNLFLKGDSGLARSFAHEVAVLRALPEDELTALVALLPEAEATLLRESALALRAQPETDPATLLTPALSKYWQEHLRSKVRLALYQLTLLSPASRTAALPAAKPPL